MQDNLSDVRNLDIFIQILHIDLYNFDFWLIVGSRDVERERLEIIFHSEKKTI